MPLPKGEITSITIGVPGPPGTGVSAAEKATYVTTSGSPAFTTPVKITVSNANALLVEDAGGADVLRVNTSSPNVQIAGGYDLTLYSDTAYASAKASIDGATGNTVLSGTLTTTRIIGETTILPIVIDGGGSAITTGVKVDLPVPYAGTVTGWDIYSDVSGSIVVDLWQDTYANFPPTVADTITGANKPTLSSATKNTASSLSWSLTQGSVIRVNVDSVATVTRVMIALRVTKA